MNNNDALQQNNPITKKDLVLSKDIQQLIRNVRGKQVILDNDLAQLYQVETKQLNRQVKRNIERFPEDFMFQLNKQETENLRCQIGTSSEKNEWGGKRYLPYAFTEQGISMLSGVLRSNTAIEVNIQIMRAFVAMRHFIRENIEIFDRLEVIEHNQLLLHDHQAATDERLNQVFEIIGSQTEKRQQGIFFNGQIYDSYSFVSDLIRNAEKRIVLIDNYIDDSVLTMLNKRKKDVSVLICTASVSKNLRLDIDRYNAQYPQIEIKELKIAHDRFLIIDETIYHIGASIKDLGKKLFAFSVQKVMTATEFLSRLGID